MTLDLSPLTEREQVIAAGLKTYVEVGMALADIRSRELYRLAGYDTFKAYVEGRWGFTDSHARQLVLGAETAVSIEAEVGVKLPNERCARALKTYPADLRPAIAKIVASRSRAFGAPITEGRLRAVGDILVQAVETGAVDVNGEATAFDAALTEAEFEVVMRQSQTVRDKLAAKNGGRHMHIVLETEVTLVLRRDYGLALKGKREDGSEVTLDLFRYTNDSWQDGQRFLLKLLAEDTE